MPEMLYSKLRFLIFRGSSDEELGLKEDLESPVSSIRVYLAKELHFSQLQTHTR